MNGKAIKLPTPEEIAICAYLIWEKEGCPPGRDAAHWLQAEKQLHADCLHENGTAAKPARFKSTRPTKAVVTQFKQLQELRA